MLKSWLSFQEFKHIKMTIQRKKLKSLRRLKLFISGYIGGSKSTAFWSTKPRLTCSQTAYFLRPAGDLTASPRLSSCCLACRGVSTPPCLHLLSPSLTHHQTGHSGRRRPRRILWHRAIKLHGAVTLMPAECVSLLPL